jgi:hypothetical protein
VVAPSGDNLKIRLVQRIYYGSKRWCEFGGLRSVVRVSDADVPRGQTPKTNLVSATG